MMHPDARSIWAALACVMGVASLHAGDPVAPTPPLVIGLLLPPEEPQAASLREGAMLGVDLANQSPGTQVSLVIRGRSGQWGADGVEAARMVTDDGAQGLIAPTDGAATHLVLQVSGRTAVPVITLCGDSSVTDTGVPWMARVVPRTIDEANALFSGIRARHWVAVVPNGRAGREAARDLETAAARDGCEPATILELDPAATNLEQLGGRILARRPDAVLLWLDPATAGTLAKVLRAAGFTGALAGPGRLRAADFARQAGDAQEGLMVATPVLSPDAAAALGHFAVAFRDRFGHEPDPTATAACDAAMLLVQALRQGNARPAQAMLPPGSSFTGASGVLAFDARGNRTADLELRQAQGGRFLRAGAANGQDP